MLLAHCALYDGPREGCENEDPKAGLVRLVRDTARYHSRAYEESYVGPLWGGLGSGGDAGAYADMDAFLEANMGPDAWAVVRLMVEARTERTCEMRSRLDG